MKLYLNETTFFDTSEGIDISIPIGEPQHGARAWYVDYPVFEPVRANGYIGSVQEGGSVNFRNIFFNPHGNGTHTECLGHITPEVFSINTYLKEFFFEALLVTVQPTKQANGDWVITQDILEKSVGNTTAQALVVRTLPNNLDKLSVDYSTTNPPYFDKKCIGILDKMGVEHLLIDLPSVDRESDNGVLAMHHAFWQVPENPQYHKTITEFIFVPSNVLDGKYVLNLQVAPFVNDASPSRPVLYALK